MRCSSLVQHLPGTLKALWSIPRMQDERMNEQIKPWDNKWSTIHSTDTLVCSSLGEGFNSSYSLQSITEGSQDSSSRQEPRGGKSSSGAYQLMACSLALLYNPGWLTLGQYHPQRTGLTYINH